MQNMRLSTWTYNSFLLSIVPLCKAFSDASQLPPGRTNSKSPPDPSHINNSLSVCIFFDFDEATQIKRIQ